VGVFYGRNDPRNISTSLQGILVHQTNQRAELTALKLALEWIVNKPDSFACDSNDWNTTNKSKTLASATTRKKQVIIIKSDSNYCVRGFKTWLKNWKKKGWLNSKKEPVANQDLWRQVDTLNARIALLNGIDVKVEWVRGHNAEEGNEEADKLAVDGIVLGADRLEKLYDGMKCLWKLI
jgi:ribonuclease HI